MSTELVAIEKIEIRHGDKNADEIRMELVKYLRQFLDSASIESMALHDLAISINGEMILYLVDKTGGKGFRGLDEDWQKDHKTVDSVNMILNDVDVTVVLSYEMIHYFSNDTFYGFNYWSDVLQGNESNAVTYHGLEYYDCESSISMLHFENGVLTDSPDYVSEKKVADIHAWFCYNFELDLEVDDEFSADQRTRIEKALDSIRDMSGIEDGDFADIDETTLHIFSSMTVKKEQVSVFTDFLTTIREIAVECDATLDVTAEFVPLDFEEFAAMIMDFENGKAVPKYFRY